jgi:hypothetical protein
MDVQVKLNLRGINVVLRAQQPLVDAIGRRAAARAGRGFEYSAEPHPWTARGYVQTADAVGRRREATDKVLLQSLPQGE